MHESVIAFAQRVLRPEMVAGKIVLEVGSRNVNGSVRPVVEAMSPLAYTGLDMEMGPGVDVVANATRISELFVAADLVVSTEMLEHAEDWRTVVREMKNVLRPNGHLLVTTRSKGFPLHEYPSDWWRYSLDDMRKIFADMEIVALESDPQVPGVFMLARRLTLGTDVIPLESIHLHAMQPPK